MSSERYQRRRRRESNPVYSPLGFGMIAMGLALGYFATRASDRITPETSGTRSSYKHELGPQIRHTYQDSMGNIYTQYEENGIKTYTIIDSSGTLISSGTGVIVEQRTGNGVLYMVVPNE